MLKKIKYGASIHPGNLFYIAIVLACFAAGLQNENAPWWIGLVVLVFLIPLYLWTSYEVGKANWPPETDSQKK